MQIHELQLAPRKKTKVIGRGGKRGTTSGRGTKGQGAHGKHKDPLFEGGRSSLVERMKKLRGFKSIYQKPFTVTLRQLDKHFADGEKVTLDSFVEKKLFGKIARRSGVKVVSTGELKKKLVIAKDINLSASAVEAVKKAGGSVEE
jgi:large subunit ribosomal protein L15